MAYTKKETIDKVNNEILTIETLYKSDCIKWTGTTSDSDERYTEVISNELLKNLSVFDSIKKITRTESYKTENHCDVSFNHCTSNRNEPIFAKRLVGLNLDGLGKIVDYEIPLKDKSNDGVGKIDLISYEENEAILRLIELKFVGNKETLLRAILEIYTYLKVVDGKKLQKDFSVEMKTQGKTIKTIPTVLLVPGCNAYEELNDMDLGYMPKLKALSLALGIEFFSLDLCADKHEL